ncbi:hypothetical protein DFH94DRAFT_775299 [Russula ochroleuca]|uniref:Secreted protein n=1 Tax=Russula ochroleuca TaxID=152965 RepID=A0A9P5JWU3_9AGAM|nr:hypothetical protein DFH94DRAFT_775299 [Russula ochroleuca]
MHFTCSHKSLVFCAWRITCVLMLGTSTRHCVNNLVGMQDAATQCRPLMAASVLRAFRQDDIREKGGGHLHRCASTRSSNFGADKIVTVPARASRSNAKRDMIDEGDMSSWSIAAGWSTGVRRRNGDEGEGRPLCANVVP